MNAKAPQPDLLFFDRDLSWLSFNERVLSEAARDSVPLMERFRFLAIYSSNLDEFYRVRMPTLMALNKLRDDSQHASDDTLIAQINSRIEEQLNRFGTIINNQIIPALKSRDIHLVYNEQLPESIRTKIQAYFIHTVAGYLHILDLSEAKNFFPENNKIYLAVLVQPTKKGEQLFVVNIPSDVISRFFKTSIDNKEYIIFLDDVIKANLPLLFPDKKVLSYSFKVTRNAELDLEDEFTGNLAKKIERKIVHRDFGLATRFLYEPGLPENTILYLKDAWNLKAANFIAGGTYHNLKDLFFLPLHQERFNYEAWPKVELQLNDTSLFAEIKTQMFSCTHLIILMIMCCVFLMKPRLILVSK